MKVIFFSSGTFGLPTLEALVRSQHEVCCVVTAPDKRVGRGQRVQTSPMRALAAQKQIPVLSGDVNESTFLQKLKACAADVFVVVSFGQIFGKEFLDTPPMGCINVHTSLLPKYRGASPIVTAILNGETETGVSTMRLVEKLDAGDVLMQASLKLSGDEDAGEIASRLAPIGGKLLVKTLDALRKGDLAGTPQDESQASYAPKLKKADARIIWQKNARQIHNQVRAFRTWPGSRTRFKEKELIIQKTSIADENTLDTPGRVLSVSHPKGIVVGAGKGTVLVQTIKPEGKRDMSHQDFINGYRLQVNDKFE